MKKTVVLTVFAVLFLVMPATAQRRGDGAGSRFEDYFGWQSAGRGSTCRETVGAVVKREEVDEAQEIASKEFLRIFVEKGFTITPEEKIAHLVAEIKNHSAEKCKLADFRCYCEHESIVYLTIRHRENYEIIAVGRGKDSNIRRAAEKAANDAAKKIKREHPKKEDWSINLP